MNYVVIKAGGTGVRVQPSDCPKQFIEILGKPIIVYTLEIFQESNFIDDIVVSCLEGWEDYMQEIAQKYNITKLSQIVTGGANGHLSTKNGILALNNKAKPGDVVVIHDAVRPMFSEETLLQTINDASKFGAAVACAQAMESMFICTDGKNVEKHQPPYIMYRAQAPQAYEYATLFRAFNLADEKNLNDCISTDHLFMSLNLPIRAVVNGQQNFKITTREDVDVFNAVCFYNKFYKEFKSSNND